MKVRRFRARNFAEALELVRREFGEEAIILSSEEPRDGAPYVEVTAAVDYELGGTKRQTATAGGGGGRDAEGRAANEIVGEIRALREMISLMQNRGLEISLPERKKRIYEFLRRRAVDEELSLRLSGSAEAMDEVPSLIARDIKVRGRDFEGKAVMVVGPTGVGKTTTIAKLTAHAIREGKKVAIISTDCHRIGAVEQIRVYARVLGVPMAIVTDFAQLRHKLAEFARTRDVVFVDTTGRNPKRGDYVGELARGVESLKGRVEGWGLGLELHLLMGANYDGQFALCALERYSALPIDCIAFTKVDEAARCGALYNTIVAAGKPVAYITTGQVVPFDIEFPTRERLVNLILNHGTVQR